MFKLKGQGMAAFAIWLGIAASAHAGEERVLYASLGDTARAPIGWVEFCADNPGECKAGATHPPDIVTSPRARGDLVRVNRWVKEAIKPMTDMDHWGVIEKWSIP